MISLTIQGYLPTLFWPPGGVVVFNLSLPLIAQMSLNHLPRGVEGEKKKKADYS